MSKKECIAMLLAGGEGRRLGVLTHKLAKPAVPFGGKYRIIDFALSNCTNSGIDTVGVLTQYQPLVLHTYLGIGSPWDLDRKHGGVTVLPPFQQKNGGTWYAGTANAIYQNIPYIQTYDPDYVLVLSGDHIYKMNYDEMLQEHKAKGAAVTIAAIRVPWEEASRFGIINVDEEQWITGFEEKPENPKTNLASMGIYIFNWKLLHEHLLLDNSEQLSSHDFGKDVLPAMLKAGMKMNCHLFQGYWKDVGTIESLYEAHMDIVSNQPQLDMNDSTWRIYSVNPNQPPQYLAAAANVQHSLINEGCMVFGDVAHSVLFYGVHVGTDTKITHSVIMPNVIIGKNVRIHKAIIGAGTVIGDNCQIGGQKDWREDASEYAPIVVIGEETMIPDDSIITSDEGKA
ncbi:glucose-1-phosphate adenylyltransferase [Fodinisporobacter ferrooxydans]|uniref:Glucose-1-phosphate adenylyltransferase n=1 Tax=Fodinisporobacter ferrooxydans TaxID=2901836 RepID=A0ABY4CGT5_9BACL|nr:glucose-1-phosphate adenylyltransferase [Alicyclobacillaceae bacterium MYW30-H2]